MKKIIALFSMIAIILSFTACNENGQVEYNYDFDVAETRDIVLGEEVSSVVLTTAGGGKVTYDNSADFYEILDNISFNFENGIKCSYVAEIKLADQDKSYINMNSYHIKNAEFYEFRVKKDGDDRVAVIDEYVGYKQLEDGRSEMVSFANYEYKEEKAFCGSESGITYGSDEYPMIPTHGTELCDMQGRATYLRSLCNSIELFARYEAFENDGNTYDFDEFVTREYKMYENYIVFKQTAPFLSLNTSVPDPYIRYMQVMSSDCSITQEAYCNVETGKIELIKIYGDTMWHTVEYYGRKAEIDIQLYVYDIVESEYKEKIDVLIDYIKSYNK